MTKICLDVCCLNRPFDDQTQDRIRLEAEAVLVALGRVEAGDYHWLRSEVVDFEIDQTPDPKRLRRLKLLARWANSTILVSEAEIVRANGLESLGFRPMDALHIACAESGEATVFFTTDDQLLRKASRHAKALRIRVVNPIELL
ncbi:MAG: type II toxin-antitoxin system VapC family toxin [Planctomycetes bacterium]|nr:type II toxin-antitoxin system VapC family toxin [Planctomycetota bacterium]